VNPWHEVRNATAWTAGLLRPDFVDVPHAASAERLLASAALHGWTGHRLDLSGVRDKAGFMAACARDLALPDYFGANWDALWDCLTDETLLPDPGRRLVVVDHWQRFAEHARADWDAARGLLCEAVEHWRRTATPVVVLVRARTFGA
jgi:RNAse (barnase) inhibitor barstar